MRDSAGFQPQPPSCDTLLVSYCLAARREHQGWDTASLLKPSQCNYSGKFRPDAGSSGPGFRPSAVISLVVPGIDPLKKRQFETRFPLTECELLNVRLTETRGLRPPDEPQKGQNRSWAVKEFSATLSVVSFIKIDLPFFSECAILQQFYNCLAPSLDLHQLVQ
ncbi:hypothetical protein T265_11249 [Opisthorchis viverrini]|uniref:Uncharacterized protein n=1 Tax=Opisthorchis viverrini TaxID=6198 RepID=A0A074Z3N3_OPIVI|nr:hypothetical protein T265_11249 [Opisthorchis viverrini]KER20132.1 hypothetical protein T265_11249 [Opisthorchis viverrini]